MGNSNLKSCWSQNLGVSSLTLYSLSPPYPNHQQTLLGQSPKIAKIGSLLTFFSAATSVQATSISCLGYCNHFPFPWFSPCPLLSEIVVEVMLLKSKSDSVTPLLKTLQGFPIWLNIKAKFLQCPTRVYMIWGLVASLRSSPPTPSLGFLNQPCWFPPQKLFLEHAGSFGGELVHFVPLSIHCRHEFKVRPAGTVVYSLHIQLGMSVNGERRGLDLARLRFCWGWIMGREQ